MENQNNSEAIIGNEQTKLEWNSPEVEVLSVKDKTLAGASGLTDSGVFS
ncbi:hypothetical protein [Emticicia fontis]